jgi:hypothetical protein
MIVPTGPMPPEVYRRRRVVAVVVTAASVVALAWIVGRLVGGADDEPLHAASARASQPPSARSVPASASSSSAAPSSSAEPASPAAAAPPPPPPPQPCPDAVLQVLAGTGAPSYRVGERPLLRLVIVNAGQLACTRDVSRALRELIITSADGTHRLWSSNDCYAPPGTDTRLLQPGERLEFTVNWAGRTSAPGCPIRRRTLPPGTYLLTPKLGPLAGTPVPLDLTP